MFFQASSPLQCQTGRGSGKASGAGAEFPALVPGCSEVSLALNKQPVTSAAVIAKVTQDGLTDARTDKVPMDAPPTVKMIPNDTYNSIHFSNFQYDGLFLYILSIQALGYKLIPQEVLIDD